MNDTGRPEFPDEQYQTWLGDMAPFLKLGNTLNYAIEKGDLSKHKDTIYRKFRLNDWFCEKIQAFQQYPSEIVNSIFTRLILTIDDKVKQGLSLNDEEWRNLRFFAERHRSCQQFFTNKPEPPKVDENKIAQVLDQLELGKNDYALFAKQAGEQLEQMEKNNQTNLS